MSAEPRQVGPYRLVRRLATGGMAEVFEAVRPGPHGFEKRVALKRILPQSRRDPEFTGLFVDEARLASRLDHPNLVHVFDFGETEEGELFLAMEFVDGTNVNRLLRRLASRREVLPVDLAVYICAQVARGLSYAHRLCDEGGKPLLLVHRDVSPANILLTRHGHPKLTDFGIATASDRSAQTEHGQVRGQLGYMSPEQVLGRPLDAKSDVFTLAIVLAELLLVDPIFARPSDIDCLVAIRDVNLAVWEAGSRRLPEDVRRVVLWGLSKDATKRPSAAAFGEALEEILRRRGLGQIEERLAKILERLGLVEPGPGDEADPFGRGTALVETDRLKAVLPSPGDGPASTIEFRVRMADGRLLGPMSLPKLILLFTTGQIDGETLVARGETEFEPARVHPELTRFVTSPALSWSTDELSSATVTGELGAGRLVPVFFDIVSMKRTGVLHLFHGARRKKIYFVDGRPEFVASTDSKELLGEHLVATGACLRMEVDMALAVLPRFGGRLGEALVGLGVLRPIDLVRAINAQVRERLLEAFRWRRGRYAFVPDVRSHEETFPLGYDPYELLRDAVARAPIEELVGALEPIAERPVLVEPAPPAALPTYRLPDDWYALLSSLRGVMTFGQVLARETSSPHGLDPESVHRAFFFGLSCGFLRRLGSERTVALP